MKLHEQNTEICHALLDHVEIVSIISLVYDVFLRFDQHLEHAVQNFRELLLEGHQAEEFYLDSTEQQSASH